MVKRVLIVLLAIAAMPAAAALKVFATVPEWGALVQEIGGDKVQVHVATSALQDPHRIEAKPSLIARARSADLVVATGADLEIGWLPLVLRESGNAGVQPGRPGYFEAAALVRLLDVPTRVDRTEGDVHAAGNPHIQTDPRNMLSIGEALAARLAHVDPPNAAAYRAGYAAFADRWRLRIRQWEARAAPLRGVAVVSQHRAWTYLYDWLGLREVAALEPKPGVEASLAHLARVRDQAVAVRPRMVIRAAYDPSRPADWFSREAGVPVVALPFTVGGTPGANDLEGLFDDTVSRLLGALR